jgi:hypothetical protein
MDMITRDSSQNAVFVPVEHTQTQITIAFFVLLDRTVEPAQRSALFVHQTLLLLQREVKSAYHAVTLHTALCTAMRLYHLQHQQAFHHGKCHRLRLCVADLDMVCIIIV